jgi:hypothetical protein
MNQIVHSIRLFISKLNSIIYWNTKSPYKSIAHFFRNTSVWCILYSLAVFIVLPFYPAILMGTNPAGLLLFLVVSIVIFIVSKLFIKE